MKKIITVLAMLALLTACSKPAPATPTASNNSSSGTTTQKYNYSYDYKKSGDPTTYSGSGCFSQSDITYGQSTYGWTNIQKWGPC